MNPGATLPRRGLLRLAAAAAALACAPRRGWPQTRAFPDEVFALGVASGTPDAQSVVLWTRLVHDTLPRANLPVRWEIAHDERFARVARSGEVPAVAELAHTVHVEAGGLEPDREYFYRFTAGGAVSPTGRTRTLPAPGAEVAKLRLAYASCQRWEHGYYAAWRHLRDDAPDHVVFLGDYIYEYPTAGSPVRPGPGVWASTLEGYRARYAFHRADRDLQAMHAACPWFLSWDDHEVQNDHAGLRPGDSGPPVDDFAARRAAAYQAFYEHMPLRASALGRSFAQLRVHATHRFGQLAALHLLDLRQHKDAPACTPMGRAATGLVDPASACEAWRDPRRSLLGAEQEAWLDAQLAQRGSAWTVLGQATLFGALDRGTGEGRRFWNDGWDGYGAARERLLQSLQRHAARNPVILGGDVHENWVGHVKADYARPESANVGVEFCGTSITSRSGGAPRTAQRLAKNPHFVFGDARKRGYGLADFTPGQLQVTLRAVDEVERADSGISTLARFAVAAGRPVVERV